MHYKVSKGGFTLSSLLKLWTYEVFQDSYPRPILKHAFEFWLAEIYFEPAWKSGLTKTGPAGLVLLPLYIHQYTAKTLIIFICYDSSLAVFRWQRILNILWTSLSIPGMPECRLEIGTWLCSVSYSYVNLDLN